MKREIKPIIMLFIVISIVKILSSYFIPASRTLADDYNYLKMSESFFYHFSLNVHGFFSGQFHPLYPIIISVAQIFKDNDSIYLGIKIINSILSSLIIFPTYLLSREFLSYKKSLFVSLLVSLIPANFALTSYIMAENLFYSLFLFSIYFIYKSFWYREFKYYLLAGIFIGLTYLTRINGLILFWIVALLISIDILKKRFDKNSLLILLISSIISLPF